VARRGRKEKDEVTSLPRTEPVVGLCRWPPPQRVNARVTSAAMTNKMKLQNLFSPFFCLVFYYPSFFPLHFHFYFVYVFFGSCQFYLLPTPTLFESKSLGCCIVSDPVVSEL
jgi:hypothetical protein